MGTEGAFEASFWTAERWVETVNYQRHLKPPQTENHIKSFKSYRLIQKNVKRDVQFVL